MIDIKTLVTIAITITLAVTMSFTINLNYTINVTKEEVHQLEGQVEEHQEIINKTIDQIEDLDQIIEERT